VGLAWQKKKVLEESDPMGSQKKVKRKKSIFADRAFLLLFDSGFAGLLHRISLLRA
jgi:hypothetical protein